MMHDGIKHGVTAETPKNILLGAGTIHKGLTYDTTSKKWNFAESLIGATSGGNKLTITPEVTPVEVDGALVKIKGLDHKTGETATLETNIIEITPEIMRMTVLGEIMEETDYSVVQSKADIEVGDYLENLGFVGVRGDGQPIIVILPNAICTSGFEGENKNKENTVVKCTFECEQDIDGDLSTLPYKIYFPKVGGNA